GTGGPGTTLSDVHGAPFSLSDYRGRVVILDFMATWCGPCLVEINHLAVVHERFGDQIAIISVSVSPSSDTDAKLLEYAKDHDISWTVARDTVGLGDAFRVTVIPTIVIIDQRGDQKFRHEGVVPEAILSSEIDELLRA
ncbi:MAG: TlpA family protein disulfide reductase, partial [Candidatus Bathyarchaeia archaeon]